MFGIFWTASCNYCFSSELLYFTNLALHSHTTVRLMMDSFQNKTKQNKKSIKVDATEPKKVLFVSGNLPYQNLALPLPTMQRDQQQFGQRFDCADIHKKEMNITLLEW